MMRANQLLTVFATVTFSILLESLPVKAFNLIYKYPSESPNYVNEAEYITPSKNKGRVWVDTIQKIPPPSLELLQAFKAQFPLYNFEASYTPIYGDLVVESYQACPPAPNVGFCLGENITNVGALINLDYLPKTFYDPQLKRNYNDFPDPKTGLVRWGMNGFGTAYPHVMDSKWVKISRLGDFTFDYQHSDGESGTQALITVKAHNLILDTTLSVGMLGLMSYLMVLGLCLWLVVKSPYRGIETLVVVYLVFTFTWFECAQFTHIVWWAVSFFGISSVREKITP